MRRHDMLPALRELGDAFTALEARARVASARTTSSSWRARQRRLAISVAALTLAAGGVAGARHVFVHSEDPVRSAVALPDRFTVGGDAGVARAIAADPSGGLPWGARIERRGSLTCVVSGRVRAGVLGALDGRGAFRALPSSAPGICGDPLRDGVLVAADRRGLPSKRTVVYGVAAPHVHNLAVITPAGRERVLPATDGSFVLVADRILAAGSPRLEWTAAGRVERRALP